MKEEGRLTHRKRPVRLCDTDKVSGGDTRFKAEGGALKQNRARTVCVFSEQSLCV